MYTIRILDALSGFYINKDGQRYETNFLLTETSSDRGVRFELQRCTKDCFQEAKEAIDDTVNLFYDKFGRVSCFSHC